jgi:malate dehydrogenase (oxaloacetate-decarboxylating)(NADP+)
MGFRTENVILCDTKGVIYRGRTEGMNQWKSAHAVETKARTLAEALEGADVFFGLSVKGAVTQDMVKSMARSRSSSPWPIPIPRSRRKRCAVRDDAIIATGRSDYPNQVNNVLGFPYIFRGALDVRASTINDGDEDRRGHALAALAREDVPDEVAAAYGRAAEIRPRLHHSGAVRSAADLARAAGGGGRRRWIRRRAAPIEDMDAYRHQLRSGSIRSPACCSASYERCAANPRVSCLPKAKRSR